MRGRTGLESVGHEGARILFWSLMGTQCKEGAAGQFVVYRRGIETIMPRLFSSTKPLGERVRSEI
jgi:hypothetical protein